MADHQSFFAGIDQRGELGIVFPIFWPSRAQYRGSLTSVAISRADDTLWACGRSSDQSSWYVYSFKVSTMSDFDWSEIEHGEDSSYKEVDIHICHSTKLPDDLRVSKGKEKCTLSWDAKTRLLWAGNHVQ